MKIKERFPQITVITGDCQKRLDYPDKYFDKVIAIHVLEHLPDLSATIEEVKRLLKKEGIFAVVIPCEGGMVYSLARRISAQRIFEKRYNMSYDWCIKSEHINKPKEIIEELRKHFIIKRTSFFPFQIPLIGINLVIGLICEPK